MAEHIGTGHSWASAFGVHIDYWGDGPLIIRSGKRVWRFEFSEMFGPTILDRHNAPAKRQPISETDPFWFPFQRWMNAGRRVRSVRNKRGQVIYKVCHWPRGFRNA
jgi:hypothetical protein